MTPDIHQVKLTYPDGWVETWSFRPGAAKDSLIAAAIQLLDLAGVEVKILLADPVRSPAIAAPHNNPNGLPKPPDDDANAGAVPVPV